MYDSATPWTVAHQAPLRGFCRQEYWSGLSFPSPGHLPNPGIKPRSPALQADSLLSEPSGKPTVVTHPAGNAGDKRPGFSPWVGKIPWRRKWQPTPVFLLGKLQRETYRDTECTRTHTRFKAKRFKGTNKTPKGTSLYLRPISS